METMEEPALIKIGIHDTQQATSTVVRAFSNTLASHICDSVATKLDMSAEDAKYYNLILVLTTAKNGSGTEKSHTVRTLKSHEVLVHVLEVEMDKLLAKIGQLDSAVLSRWYYKDTRTSPLDFNDKDGDISGNSSSEEEEDLSLDSQSYLLQQNARRGDLWRRSTKDENLWRRRTCVLTDKLWCIDSKKNNRPKAISIIVNGSVRIFDRVAGHDYPYCVALYSSIGGKAAIVLRASSPSDQIGWIESLRERCNLNAHADAINMAEIIMCDEVRSQSTRLYKTIDKTLDIIVRVPNQILCDANVPNVEPLSTTDAASDDKLLFSITSSTKRIHRSACYSFLHQCMDEFAHNYAVCPRIKTSDAKPTEVAKQLSLAAPTSIPASPATNSPLRSNRNAFTAFYAQPELCRRKHWKRSEELEYSMAHAAEQALAFIASVGMFKELYRHDLMVSSRKQWKAVTTIYQKFILPELVRSETIKHHSSSGSSHVNSNSFNTALSSAMMASASFKDSKSSGVFGRQRSATHAGRGDRESNNTADQAFDTNNGNSSLHASSSSPELQKRLKASHAGWTVSHDILSRLRDTIFTNVEQLDQAPSSKINYWPSSPGVAVSSETGDGTRRRAQTMAYQNGNSNVNNGGAVNSSQIVATPPAATGLGLGFWGLWTGAAATSSSSALVNDDDTDMPPRTSSISSAIDVAVTPHHSSVYFHNFFRGRGGAGGGGGEKKNSFSHDSSSKISVLDSSAGAAVDNADLTVSYKIIDLSCRPVLILFDEAVTAVEQMMSEFHNVYMHKFHLHKPKHSRGKMNSKNNLTEIDPNDTINNSQSSELLGSATLNGILAPGSTRIALSGIESQESREQSMQLHSDDDGDEAAVCVKTSNRKLRIRVFSEDKDVPVMVPVRRHSSQGEDVGDRDGDMGEEEYLADNELVEGGEDRVDCVEEVEDIVWRGDWCEEEEEDEDDEPVDGDNDKRAADNEINNDDDDDEADDHNMCDDEECQPVEYSDEQLERGQPVTVIGASAGESAVCPDPDMTNDRTDGLYENQQDTLGCIASNNINSLESDSTIAGLAQASIVGHK